MALLVRDPTGAGYSQVEQELQDRILTIYGDKDNDQQLFRPDLADNHKVGFFCLDRPSQTDVTEIVDLKEMTEVLQILLQDVATLKRDINLTKHVMQADYESKLQKKSLELYCRINERVTELEKMHEERVGTVRRAFRQQLSDAIARVAVLYNKNLQRRMKNEKSRHEGDADKQEEKYKEMQMTIQRNESIIHMLKMQIQQLQNKEPSIAESVESLHSKTPSVNVEAEGLREELEDVNKQLALIQDSLQLKDDENRDLNNEINKLNNELTNEKIEKQQIEVELAGLKNAAESDKAASQKMHADLLEKQKGEMERMMAERLKQAQMASSQQAEADAKARQQAERDKLAQLYEAEKRLKEELSRERAKLAEALQGDTDINKLRKSEQMLKEEIIRLKKEIERIHRTWEKKFAILQQSLHALKDESYIRQTLQRQAAALHHAAVSYSTDTPVGIVPSSKHASPTKRPLPEIPKFQKMTPGTGHEKDYISYTVSAPSGRGTALFSADENQIMSENDREDIPADVVPLPERPSRFSKVNMAPVS